MAIQNRTRPEINQWLQIQNARNRARVRANRAYLGLELILSGSLMPDPSPPPKDTGQVIRFRPRGASPSGWRWPLQRTRPDETPVADLRKYENAKGEDDYRHRMTMNALALVTTSILVVVGIWLAVSIADMRKKQDCYLQGGRNCNQISIPQAER